MATLVAVALGGAVGSVLRYVLGRLIQSWSHASFPVGTLAVNVLGCVLVGALSRWFLNNEAHRLLQPALVVGFCGGFTTFSAFSLETVGLLTGGATLKALGYVVASIVLCLIGTSAGFFLARGT